MEDDSMSYAKPKTCDWCDRKVLPSQTTSFIYQHSDFILCSKSCLTSLKKSLPIKPHGYYDRRPLTNQFLQSKR